VPQPQWRALISNCRPPSQRISIAVLSSELYRLQWPTKVVTEIGSPAGGGAGLSARLKKSAMAMQHSSSAMLTAQRSLDPRGRFAGAGAR